MRARNAGGPGFQGLFALVGVAGDGHLRLCHVPVMYLQRSTTAEMSKVSGPPPSQPVTGREALIRKGPYAGHVHRAHRLAYGCALPRPSGGHRPRDADVGVFRRPQGLLVLLLTAVPFHAPVCGWNADQKQQEARRLAADPVAISAYGPALTLMPRTRTRLSTGWARIASAVVRSREWPYRCHTQSWWGRWD